MRNIKIYSILSLAISVLCIYGLIISFSQNRINTQRIVYLENYVQKKIAEEDAKRKQEKIGKPASDFELKDIEGNTFKLKKILGRKEVMILAFSKDCPPCREILPDFEKFYQNKKDEIEIVSVTIARDEKAKDELKKFVKKNNLNFPVLIADEKFLKDYAPFSTPSMWKIGKDGKMKEILEGKEEVGKIVGRRK
jgi:peroxiredoxin